MNLYEEYLQRHGIKFVAPKHMKKGSLFFRLENNGKINWKILTIEYLEDYNHPGKYSFRLIVPVHDALSNNKALFSVDANVDLEWDEYDIYWRGWTNAIGGETKAIVRNEKDVLLTAWEIYAYCCDSELAKNAADQKSLHRSLDLSLSSDDRFEGCLEILAYLSNKYPALMYNWYDYMLPLIRNYSFWLIDLADERKKIR